MIRTINFYGDIANSLGVDNIELDVNSPRELLSGLRSQVKDWREVLMKYPNMHFILSNDDKSYLEAISPDVFEFPINSKAEHIHIFPSIEGAGAELVAYLIMEMSMSYAMAVGISAIVTNVAISVAVGLVSSMLAPSPDTSAGSGAADQRPSFLFNGAVNVVEQGYPVPLVYGTHTTGSIVVSAGVSVAELPYETAQESPPANGTGTTQPMVPVVEDTQWGQ